MLEHYRAEGVESFLVNAHGSNTNDPALDRIRQITGEFEQDRGRQGPRETGSGTARGLERPWLSGGGMLRRGASLQMGGGNYRAARKASGILQRAPRSAVAGERKVTRVCARSRWANRRHRFPF